MVANIAGGVAAAFVVAAAWRDLDRERAWWLAWSGLLGLVPAAVVVRWLPAEWVGLVVSVLVLLALLLTVRAPGGSMRDSRAVRTTVGASCGFLGTAAGVGGPPLAIYMRGIGWDRQSFAPSVSAVFVVQSAVAVLAKGVYPSFGAIEWGVVLALVTLGVPIGAWVNRRMNDRSAMRVVMAMAFIGTVLALGRSLAVVLG